jgi:DNA modification methylase
MTGEHDKSRSPPYHRKETNGRATLILGDCLEALQDLPPDSVDSIVTDPPSGIRFMGKPGTASTSKKPSLQRCKGQHAPRRLETP